MADFSKAISMIMAHEGGLVNNKNDPGEITNFGISLKFLKSHIEEDVDKDGDIDAQDILKLTREQAVHIYKTQWWDKYNYGAILDQTIATKIFDFAVNMGASKAHSLMQTSLNNAFSLKLSCDGVLGPATIHTINCIHDGDEEQILITEYCNTVWSFYQSLIRKNPKLKVFEKGWKNRAFDINTSNSIK